MTLIKPVELESREGADTWEMITAASRGDIATLQRLHARDRRLARAEYWYAPAIHFAVREGHADAVRLLLDAGADPERNGLNDRTLIEMARERGQDLIAEMLTQVRDERGRIAPQRIAHPIHRAAARGEIDSVGAMLDADATLVHRGCPRGFSPLHYAAAGGQLEVVELLLDRGARLHARSVEDWQPIDCAIWTRDERTIHERVARLLIARGATHDLTVAAALGDLDDVRRMLDADPARISEARPGRRRPLSASIQFGHDAITGLLLERGADPCWEEHDAPHGRSMHWAARSGKLALVQLLLDHGADPNEDIDSTSPPIGFAATEEIRALIESRGGGRGLFDTAWVEQDDEMLKRVAAEPDAHVAGIGAAFTMSADRPEILERLLGAGLRMPAVHTACQGYLINPIALRLLLAHGMSPDQMNWQHQTLLHLAATVESTDCAAILLDAGADITARDDEYRSTPLAWAARANRPLTVAFLLSRGAPVNVADDEPWATPLAWAERRGHEEVTAILRAHGATR
jgi:ankyrin repeat protein